jgi:DNA-binding MarR family transcriptional regulator
MDALTERIAQQLIRVINSLIFTEKKKIIRIKGVSLHPSEVHLMLAVTSGINTNATWIAKQLGLTKGAVSQTISRLCKKGVLQKTKDPFQKNELTLCLTPLGQKALELCAKSQQEFLNKQAGYLDGLAGRDKKVILDFLKHMDQVLKD